jgi:hypothetical protein
MVATHWQLQRKTKSINIIAMMHWPVLDNLKGWNIEPNIMAKMHQKVSDIIYYLVMLRNRSRVLNIKSMFIKPNRT